MKTIYLAGGCFWGTEHFFALVNGVVQTKAGYANGTKEKPSYEEVCSGKYNFAETVEIIYDETTITLSKILEKYFLTINPTSLNKQGGDIGIQYRTGIYYIDEEDKTTIENSIESLQKKYNDKIQIEFGTLENFYLAEEYHQKYLIKNPNGYCHIPPALFFEA